jgi:hypothetical protein
VSSDPSRLPRGLWLHRVFMAADVKGMPEPQRSSELLRVARQWSGEDDPNYRYYADRVAAGGVLCGPGWLPSDDK